MNQGQNELKHYGVLSVKWGKRRTTPDGSLTPFGQKRVSKQYKKLAVKVEENTNRTHTDRYVRAYNKTANEYNNSKIDEFNQPIVRNLKPMSPTMKNNSVETLTRILKRC